jgi:hypothetical protein
LGQRIDARLRIGRHIEEASCRFTLGICE